MIMLEWMRSMIQQASVALQASDVPALARLCAEAEIMPPVQERLTPGEAAALQIPVAGFGRQVKLAGNNVRLRQVLLDSKTGGRGRWVL